MNGKRQKTSDRQLPLPLAFADRRVGVNLRRLPRKGSCATSRRTRSSESPTSSDRLMESIVDPVNLACAMARVIANGGAPGVDGMRVKELEKYFERHLDRHCTGELLSGTYRPQPVKRVEIPKPDGGMRKLGIPTAVDRVIQQAILLVLSPQWDETFSDNSFGFRPVSFGSTMP